MKNDTCDKERGSLACEECDNWIITNTTFFPGNPVLVAIKKCKLDQKGGKK